MAKDATRTVTIALPGTRAASVPSVRVAVQSGPDRGLVVELSKPSFVVGRAAGADVRLADPTVSRFHAELSVTPDGIDITDLGSHNGVRLGPVVLRAGRAPFGGEMVMGSTSLVVHRGADFTPPRSSATSFGELAGASAAMRDVYALLERLAATDLTVLIEGETGTGKELAARALHDEGARRRGPFVTVDCTSIPATLAESLLFGHEKGAFTGATERKAGLFEAAEGGTLFFDEVGELPRDLQPKLLRALERREVLPLGAHHPHPVDARVLSATWRDLRGLVNEGTFREDLYFRLAQARVRMPSLAERPDDLRALVARFVDAIPPGVAAARSIAPEALDTLISSHFRGNVRELKSTVERLAMLSAGPVIELSDVAFDRRMAGERRASPARAAPLEAADVEDPSAPLEPFKDAKRTVVDDFEREYLAKLLARAGSNVSRAAALAGIERQSLRDLLRKHGLKG